MVPILGNQILKDGSFLLVSFARPGGLRKQAPYLFERFKLSSTKMVKKVSLRSCHQYACPEPSVYSSTRILVQETWLQEPREVRIHLQLWVHKVFSRVFQGSQAFKIILWNISLGCPDSVLWPRLVILLCAWLGTSSPWHAHRSPVEHLAMGTRTSRIAIVTGRRVDETVVATTVAVSRGGCVAWRGPAGSAHVRTARGTDR